MRGGGDIRDLVELIGFIGLVLFTLWLESLAANLPRKRGEKREDTKKLD